MTDTDWHVPPTLLHRFTADPLGIDDVTASSIEAHVVECAACRREMATAVDRRCARRELGRRSPTASTVPAPRWASGSSSGWASTAATPACSRRRPRCGPPASSRSWSSRPRRWSCPAPADAEGPFLVLAPLAPLLMVGLSFAPTDDPATRGRASPRRCTAPGW